MKFRLLILLIIAGSMQTFAQSKTVHGFVIDKYSKLRIAKVYVYNSANDQGAYNNVKGEFTSTVKLGDTLFAALSGYAIDSIVFNGQSAIVFQLRPLSIRLNEVKIIGKKLTAQEQYAKNLREYRQALVRASSKDMFTVGGGGVGLSIDAIYNLLSRDGKNARRLQAILERDYHDAIIDFRFRPSYIKTVISINEEDLADFMVQYRPTYEFTLSASDFDFVTFIKNSFTTYKRNPNTFRLPSLPKDIPIEKQ
jgi:hypothetical protein